MEVINEFYLCDRAHRLLREYLLMATNLNSTRYLNIISNALMHWHGPHDGLREIYFYGIWMFVGLSYDDDTE